MSDQQPSPLPLPEAANPISNSHNQSTSHDNSSTAEGQPSSENGAAVPTQPQIPVDPVLKRYLDDMLEMRARMENGTTQDRVGSLLPFMNDLLRRYEHDTGFVIVLRELWNVLVAAVPATGLHPFNEHGVRGPPGSAVGGAHLSSFTINTRQSPAESSAIKASAQPSVKTTTDTPASPATNETTNTSSKWHRMMIGKSDKQHKGYRSRSEGGDQRMTALSESLRNDTRKQQEIERGKQIAEILRLPDSFEMLRDWLHTVLITIEKNCDPAKLLIVRVKEKTVMEQVKSLCQQLSHCKVIAATAEDIARDADGDLAKGLDRLFGVVEDFVEMSVNDQSKQPAYILIVSGDQDPITARMRTEYAVGGDLAPTTRQHRIDRVRTLDIGVLPANQTRHLTAWCIGQPDSFYLLLEHEDPEPRDLEGGYKLLYGHVERDVVFTAQTNH